jgi:hypothetical protein
VFTHVTACMFAKFLTELSTPEASAVSLPPRLLQLQVAGGYGHGLFAAQEAEHHGHPFFGDGGNDARHALERAVSDRHAVAGLKGQQRFIQRPCLMFRQRANRFQGGFIERRGVASSTLPKLTSPLTPGVLRIGAMLCPGRPQRTKP